MGRREKCETLDTETVRPRLKSVFMYLGSTHFGH